MMGALTAVDTDDMPWQVHLMPVIHMEVTAEGGFEAQMEAQQELADALDETDLTYEEMRLEDITIDQQSLLKELMGGGAADGLEGMTPDASSDLPDLDDDEFTSMDELLGDEDDEDESDDDE